MQFKDGYSSIGVVLNYSHEITIANNIISTGWTGIRLWFSDNNYIINNMISDRININCCGIEIGYSNNNIIYNNKIINNWSGIAFWGSKSNLFLHNNFINSIDHHVKQSSPYFSNTWDAGNASGGNYWSDYKIRYPNAQELNHSGILDTQYTIDDTNRDNYPLIKPWTPSHVLTHYKYTIY
jgi:parallel beta-helix repeat protein